jgi:hypothetical protein
MIAIYLWKSSSGKCMVHGKNIFIHAKKIKLCFWTCDLLVLIILSHYQNRNVIPRFHDIPCMHAIPQFPRPCLKVTEHLWVLILPQFFFICFHESITIRLVLVVLLSDQVWTKNVENSHAELFSNKIHFAAIQSRSPSMPVRRLRVGIALEKSNWFTLDFQREFYACSAIVAKYKQSI